jgi:hypothetical protein
MVVRGVRDEAEPMLARHRRLALLLLLCLMTAGPAAGPARADEAGTPPAFAPDGFCTRAIAAGGVHAKLCRLLSGLLVRMEPIPDGDAVRLGKDGGVYREGEFVTVTVDVPPEVGRAHLNVVFLDESGEVLHLLPNLYARDTEVRGGQRVALGAEGRGRRPGLRDFRVAPPYGQGMILAFLSPRPLEPVGRREAETMGGFLASLQTALRTTPGEGAPVRFASAAIETRAR